MADVQRRNFLTLLSAGAVGALASPRPLLAGTARHHDAPSEAWLAGLRGKHRQFFDVGAHGNGAALLRSTAFLNAYRDAYGLKDSDVNVIFGAHGSGLSLVLNDTLWSRYALGAHFGIEDPATKAPAVRNPYSGVGSASALDTSVAALQQRGARFLGCMNSVARLSKALATKTGGDEKTIAASLLAGFLPDVTAVPAMIVAVNRAQESGLTYAWLG